MVPPAYAAAHVMVMVHDLERSVNFYTEILGLRVKERSGPHWASVETPGLTIGLHPGAGPEKREPGPASPILVLEVPDLSKAIKELQQRGVEVIRPEGEFRRPLAHFSDPDGTLIYFLQAKDPSRPNPPSANPPGAWADEGGQ